MSALKKLFARLELSRVQAAKLCTAALLLLLAAGLILLQLAVGLLPRALQKPSLDGIDFGISGTSKDALKELDTPVMLTLISVGGISEADEDLYRFLLEYAAASPKITVRVADPLTDTDLLSRVSLLSDELENFSILVESEHRARLISNSDLTYYTGSYIDSLFGGKISYSLYYAFCLSLATAETAELSLSDFVANTAAYFCGEAQLTNAIGFVSLDRTATLCYLTGTMLDLDLQNRLSYSGYALTSLENLRKIPANCDILMLHELDEDLTPAEAEALSTYLDGGGTLFLATNPEVRELPRLSAILADYGLGFGETRNLVAENHSRYLLSESSGTDRRIFLAHIASSHSATGDFDGEFITYYAHELVLTETDGVTLTSWLKTSELGELLLYDDEGAAIEPENEKEAVYTIGAIAEKGESRVLWLGSTVSLTAAADDLADGAGNFDLLVGALQSFSGISAEAVELAAEQVDTASLTVSSSDFVIWGILLVLLLPLLILGIGFTVRQIRRHKN